MSLAASKKHFRNAPSALTWAISSRWPGAQETLALSMAIMQPDGKVCLSLGCGLGRFLSAYARRNAKLLIGADINVENLRRCKQTSANVIRCDIERLPIRNSSMEVMECVATVEHLPNPLELMREMCRVSTRNAVCFVTWVSYDWFRAPRRKLLAVRDMVFDALPGAVARKAARLGVPCARGYGLFRNRGFTFSEIYGIYDMASMRIIWSHKFAERQIIAVVATKRI